MKLYFFTLALVWLIVNGSFAQQVNKIKFFEDTSVIKATISLNLKKIIAKASKEGLVFPATLSCTMDDGLTVNDKLSVMVRGHFRRGQCYLPPLKLIFKNHPSAAFYHLKALKLVSSCATSEADEQNLIKEYLIYKIYNLITDKSFRVRLLNLTYQDSSGTKKPLTRHAYLIEDIKEVARRNACTDWSERKFATERTDRSQMTLVAIFEYMIGNTDWSVPGQHNIRLIHPEADSLARPYVVPYDFDFSGLVGTSYSFPDERLGIENVQQRLYRGFPRSDEEITIALSRFTKQKDQIYGIINNCNLLLPSSKKSMTNYLNGFYSMLKNPEDVKTTFISDARNE